MPTGSGHLALRTNLVRISLQIPEAYTHPSPKHVMQQAKTTQLAPMNSSSPPIFHHHQPPPSERPSIEALESSIQHLVINWQRRQRWQLLLLLIGCRLRPQPQKHTTKRASWRIHLASFLESLPVHFAAIVLLLLDLVFTVLDLSSSLVSCSSNNRGSKKGVHVLYHWGGVAILSLLSAKVLALALALGGSFFTSPGHIVDGLVVIGALVLEVMSEGKGSGLLVVVSLWRVVRVVESAFELGSEAIESQIEAVLVQFDELRGENRRLVEAVAERDEIIRRLREELARLQDIL